MTVFHSTIAVRKVAKIPCIRNDILVRVLLSVLRPVAPAITSAAAAAVGARIKNLPITAEKVYRALAEEAWTWLLCQRQERRPQWFASGCEWQKSQTNRPG